MSAGEVSAGDEVSDEVSGGEVSENSSRPARPAGDEVSAADEVSRRGIRELV
jgi:hypothetical protein